MTRKKTVITETPAAHPEAQRCQREIEHITAQLRAGSEDMHGLLLALQDWSCELRLIQDNDSRS